MSDHSCLIHVPNFLQVQSIDIVSLVSDISSLSFEDYGTRLVAWFGKSQYTYSKRTHVPNNNCPSTIKTLLSTLNEFMNCNFNSVLINVYKNGNNSVGWHRDAEKELDKNHCIASISIGATRLFEVRHLFRQHQYTLPMTHGMLLIMQGAFQSEFEHRVPADDRCSEYRINLTFRKLI